MHSRVAFIDEAAKENPDDNTSAVEFCNESCFLFLLPSRFPFIFSFRTVLFFSFLFLLLLLLQPRELKIPAFSFTLLRSVLLLIVPDDLVALRGERRESAEFVVVRGDIDSDLVVERAAAGIVDLGEDVPGVIARALAVLGIRGEREGETPPDRPPLLPDTGVVPDAAEKVSLLGAVLAVRAFAGVQEAAEAVVAIALGSTSGLGVGSPAVVAEVGVLQQGALNVGDGTRLRAVTSNNVGGRAGGSLPVLLSLGRVTGRIGLGKHRDSGDSRGEQELDGNHVGLANSSGEKDLNIGQKD